MIQRIQTIYLLIVTVLMAVCLLNPIGSIITGDNEISEFTNLYIALAEGVKDYTPWALFVILLLVAVLAFVSIFLFKKRMLQIRMSLFSIILLIGYYITLIVFIFTIPAEGTNFSASWTVCLPFVAIVLDWLAIRAIGADEALVRSYERLR